MKYTYKNKGTCSASVTFEIEEGKIKNVVFLGGCNGNLKAIAKLVEGKDAMEISKILEGNTCGSRNTSCADQLSRAIKESLKNS